MNVYATALEGFARARLRRRQDALEVTHEFLAKYAVSLEYLVRWRESGRRLRDWMLTGFQYHIDGFDRIRGPRGLVEMPDDLEGRSPDPVEEYMRVTNQRLVEEALRRTKLDCHDDGLADSWELFEERLLRGRDTTDLAAAWAITPSKVIDLCKPVIRRVQKSLRSLLYNDGIPSGELDGAMREIFDSLKSGARGAR